MGGVSYTKVVSAIFFKGGAAAKVSRQPPWKSFNSLKLLGQTCSLLCFKLFAKFIIVWITTNDFQIFVLMALEISPVIYFFAICVQIQPGLGSLPFHFLHSEGFSLLLVGQSHDPEKNWFMNSQGAAKEERKYALAELLLVTI